MTASKEPKLKKPKRAGDTRRQGKKSVDWKEDPEILQRLAVVSQLMNKNKRAFEIAIETNLSIATAKRDIARVRELWKEDAKDRIINSRDMAIAQYGAVLEKNWEDLASIPARSPVRAAVWNVILRTQERIDKVTGIADRVEHSGPGGAPIPVEVKDMEAIRRKRWQQIAPQLAELIKQENNATDKPIPTKKP